VETPRYDPERVEPKWLKIWEETGLYEPDLDGAQRPFYNLTMFPYPSAEGLHVGHAFTFPGGDVYGRYQRMQGYDVFQPMGLDGFGIHSENYALKVGEHPMDLAQVTSERFYSQLRRLGAGFAWNEKLETYDPEYYKWTQWLFLQLFKAGLAIKKTAPVNWCPQDLTVLADEQVISGKCERCGSEVERRDLEQWFFKITDYANRLDKNLEALDWDPAVVRIQKNWIGRSEGALIRFPIKDSGEVIETFTTRPDTVFGATFLVLAPNHPLVAQLAKGSKKVEAYRQEAASQAGESWEREAREKTGVELEARALNPGTNEEIPIWISDYVSTDYGTGAIMAVPAHDQRDIEFARKFDLPIRPVIEPLVRATAGEDAFRPEEPVSERSPAVCIVKHWSEEKYLCLRWKKNDWRGFIIGGVEGGETLAEAGAREITEETGYQNPKFIKELPGLVHAQFFQLLKGENRFAHFQGLYFELADGEREEISAEEAAIHEIHWLTPEEVDDFLSVEDMRLLWRKLRGTENAWDGAGVYANSEFLDGKTTDEGVKLATRWLEENNLGEAKTTYRLRDWLISRQRYWGPPIPIIYCEECGTVPVPEEDLPVVLPRVEEFRPTGTGQSPLATVKEFYEAACPTCGGAARRETDVSDTFLDSSWYHLRYPSVDEKNQAFDPERTRKWLPVDSYIGGREHAVLHLLYARFVSMALHDMKLTDFEEPFTRFRANGLLTMSGSKMSKSKGNVRTPDEYIERHGADALRLSLLFLGPFSQGAEFSDRAMPGMQRFLGRVWRFAHGYLAEAPESGSAGGVVGTALAARRAEAIGAVSREITEIRYNTAIAAIMAYFNELSDLRERYSFTEDPAGWREGIETLLLLLAPFAPFITEELWETLGHTESIHRSSWPEAPEFDTSAEVITIPVQVDGKVRDQILILPGASEEEAVAQALESVKVKRYLPEKYSHRYVPGRILSFSTKK
jgi:leucyl-tRNA synthetase